jgi:hypothetical protein
VGFHRPGLSGEAEMTMQNGKATCKTYRSCAAEVAYCTAEGMSHCMPGMVEESPTNRLTHGAALGLPITTSAASK